MTRRNTIENILSLYRSRFTNSKLIFDKSEYVNSHTKMIVTCPIHGDFEIRSSDLLTGTGCPKCGGTKKYNTEEFIEKANYVHNGYFTYEKCKYEGSNKKVIVTCPIHGDFSVKANNHLIGYNCPKCSKEHITHEITKIEQINASTKKITNEEFKQKVIDKYGDKYILDKVEYINNRTKITVTCREHGDFEITPNHLMLNRGCPLCSKNKRKETETIRNDIKTVHGDSIDTSMIEYNGIHGNVLLKCNKCGNLFYATPANVIHQATACPYCNESHMEKEVKQILMENNINFVQEKTFDWLINTRKLRLDFYIEYNNIAIECQGIQHFEQTFDVPLDYIIQNDKIKNNLCKEHGIKVLYYANYNYDFPYEVITDKEKLLKQIR